MAPPAWRVSTIRHGATATNCSSDPGGNRALTAALSGRGLVPGFAESGPEATAAVAPSTRATAPAVATTARRSRVEVIMVVPLWSDVGGGAPRRSTGEEAIPVPADTFVPYGLARHRCSSRRATARGLRRRPPSGVYRSIWPGH